MQKVSHRKVRNNMNREKYIKDISYREGYDDGRREGVNASIISYNEYFNRVNEAMNYLKERLNELKESEIEGKPSWWWKCERCGKLIPYMADFCHECADELLGEPPKPFAPKMTKEIFQECYKRWIEPQESEDKR